MPDSYIWDDGLVINEETGEIEEVPEGISDMVGHLISKVEGATRQRKEWQATEMAYKRALLLRMEEPRIAYPSRGLQASKRQGSKQVQDIPAIAAALMGAGLQRPEFVALLEAVRAWSPGDVESERIRSLLEEHITKEKTAEYVLVSTIKALAPKRGATLEEANERDAG